MMRLATILLAGTTMAPAPVVQDDPTEDPGYPLASQVVALTFTPKHLEAQNLYHAARGMLGSNLIVVDDESGAVSQRQNLQTVGDTVVIFDLPQAAKRHYELLEQLDQEAGAARPSRPRSVTVEYTPRYLSMNAVTQVLEAYTDRAYVNQVNEAGMVMLTGDPDTVGEMKTMLGRVDVASSQVLLTCYLLAPAEEADAKLPLELTEGLSALTHIAGFEQKAFGMVRSAIEPHTRISMLLDAGSESFSLEIVPTAMDEMGTLTLSNVALMSRHSRFGTGTSLFQTSTSVTSGEYTVLGAAGADPYFVVLRATPVRR